jgi:hypothetical protein
MLYFPLGISAAEKFPQVFYVLHVVEYKDIYARTMQVYVVHWMMWIKNQEIIVLKNILKFYFIHNLRMDHN